jgi:hypothetical protein
MEGRWKKKKEEEKEETRAKTYSISSPKVLAFGKKNQKEALMLTPKDWSPPEPLIVLLRD